MSRPALWIAVTVSTACGSAPSVDPPITCARGVRVTEVIGTVVDEENRPVPEAKAQVCSRQADGGTLLCLPPSTTESDGSFEIGVPSPAQCMERAVMRVLLPQTSYATAYCIQELPLDQSGVSFILHMLDPAIELPPEGDPDAARAVKFSDGLEIDVAPSKLSPASAYGSLSARRFDPTAPGICFADDPSAIAALYAFAPEAQARSGGFPVRIPNTGSLAPGSTVPLFVLGGLGCKRSDGSLIDEGSWEQFGTGTVTEDGAFIAGDGLPCLTWMGHGHAN